MRRFISLLMPLGLAVGVLAAPVWGQSQFSTAELDRAFSQLKAYGPGDSNAPLKTVEKYVDEATGRYKIRVDAEKRLVDVLKADGASAAAKTFAGNQLYRLCDEDTIPAFRDLLRRSDTWDIARKGLEDINHPKAQQALLEALDEAKDKKAIGIMETLGNRRDPSAVNALRRWAKAGNIPETEAALTALSKIPGPEAMEALDWCRVNLTRQMRPAATEAYLQCGWTSMEHGHKDTAIEIFDVLLIDFEPVEIKAEALRGMIRTLGEEAVPTIIEGLTSGIPELEAVAAEEANSVPGREATEAFLKAYPDLTPENQAILLHAFGARGDEAAIDTVLLAARSRIPVVRKAALESLVAFNHPDGLEALLKAAGSGTPEEQAIAREGLESLDHPRVNDELLIASLSADNAVRSEAVKTIAARNVKEGIPSLLRIAKRDVKPLRLEALKALGSVATAEELDVMVEMMLDDWGDADRAAIGEAIIRVAQRAEPGKQRTAPIAQALAKSSTPADARITLVSILKAVKDDASLDALETVARKSDPAVQRAALEVLGHWPDAQPMDTLERVARSDDDPAMRALAMEGLLHHLETSAASRAPGEQLKYYERAAKAAESPEHKRRIIEAVSGINHPDSAEVLETFLDDAQVGQEAARARQALTQQS